MASNNEWHPNMNTPQLIHPKVKQLAPVGGYRPGAVPSCPHVQRGGLAPHGARLGHGRDIR